MSKEAWLKRKEKCLREGLCRNCNSPKLPDDIRCEKHYLKALESAKRYATNLRLSILDAYGGRVCRCCGETRLQFLTVDHVNGDGAEHRKAIGRGSVYAWIKRHGYPPGFQVLCFNCNFAKGHDRECPHVAERRNKVFYTGIHNDSPVHVGTE